MLYHKLYDILVDQGFAILNSETLQKDSCEWKIC